MDTMPTHPHVVQGVHRRTMLKAALATGVTLSTWALPLSPGLWGAEDGQPKRGGILRVRGFDPPHFDERWDMPNETTYIFHLRQGVKWHNKPPLNGRELVAEDVKFTFDRFLTVPGNPERQLLESVDRVEVVDRYTVKFLLNEPFVWLLDVLANAMCMWIVAPEVAATYGDFKKVETAIGTGPFLLEHYEPHVNTVFKRNPDYF